MFHPQLAQLDTMYLTALMDSSLDFFLGSHTCIAHVSLCALIWRIYSDNLLHRKLLLLMSLVLVLLTFVLWLFVHNMWVSILTSYICVHIYERVSGPRLRIKENAVFQAGKLCLRKMSCTKDGWDAGRCGTGGVEDITRNDYYRCS